MKKFLFLAIALTSLQASAQRYEIGKAVKTLTITSATTDVDVKLSIPLYKIEERVVVERVTCRIPTCSTEVGDGSTGNWHDFFTVKTSEKPKALADAVKGIGKSTAEKIVEFNLLTNKPNSWKEFSGLVKKMEKQLTAHGYNYKFSTQVLEQYGYDNMISLGYGTEQSCHYSESLCDQVTVKEFKTLSHYIGRNLSVVVKNQSLQPFESDTVEITAGTEANDISVNANGYNNYSATTFSRGTILELDGTRILRAFPSYELTATLNKDATNNFLMNLSIPVKYLNPEDKGSVINATYDICRADWFGGCFEVVGGPWSTPLNGNKLSKTFTTAKLRKGSQYFVRVRLNKTDSQYYSGANSDRVKSNSVRN